MSQNDTNCPKCEYKSPDHTGSHTVRHGAVIDVDEYECPACGHGFERRF